MQLTWCGIRTYWGSEENSNEELGRSVNPTACRLACSLLLVVPRASIPSRHLLLVASSCTPVLPAASSSLGSSLPLQASKGSPCPAALLPAALHPPTLLAQVQDLLEGGGRALWAGQVLLPNPAFQGRACADSVRVRAAARHVCAGTARRLGARSRRSPLRDRSEKQLGGRRDRRPCARAHRRRVRA